MKFSIFRRAFGSAALVLAGSALIATGAAQAATPATIAEAGSTLVYPLAVDWSNNFGVVTGGTVTTASVGSGAGISDVCGGTVQIGASDAPLGYPGVKTCGDGTMTTMAKYVEVPWALSATGLLYHVQLSNGSYLSSGLDLTATELAKIYTGAYTNWDQLPSPTRSVTVTKTVVKTTRVHRWVRKWVRVWKKVHGQRRHVRVHKRVRVWKKIRHKVREQVAERQRITLKSAKITPVYRSDGSGDSYAFTNFLDRGAYSVWKNFGPSTSFPTSADASAVGSNGNSGVAASVISTQGAIGYVSVYYLISTLNNNSGLGVAAVGNAAGNYEYPNDANISAAAASISSPPAQNTASTTNPFGMVIQYPSSKYKTAYPVSTYTYAIVPRSSGSSASAVKMFLTYAVSNAYEGQQGGLNVGNPIGFVPLTKAVQNYDLQVIGQIGS